MHMRCSQEVIAHSMLFLLAGYETTSNTLAYIFYELALHPHVQDRMRQEVVDVLEDVSFSSLPFIILIVS